MKINGAVCATLIVGMVATTPALAAPSSAPKGGGSQGGTVATKGSGKAGKQEPGSGKGSASINGTGGRVGSASVNGTGMGAQR